MDRQQILEYLSTVSNDHTTINAVMHAIVVLAVLAILIGRWRTVGRVVVDGAVLTLLLSVQVTALVYGNPFHLVAFSLLSIVAGYEMFAAKNAFEVPRLTVNTVLSAALVITGLWYPEFVDANPAELLVLSPVGRVPCPTLLVVLGLLGLA